MKSLQISKNQLSANRLRIILSLCLGFLVVFWTTESFAGPRGRGGGARASRGSVRYSGSRSRAGYSNRNRSRVGRPNPRGYARHQTGYTDNRKNYYEKQRDNKKGFRKDTEDSRSKYKTDLSTARENQDKAAAKEATKTYKSETSDSRKDYRDKRYDAKSDYYDDVEDDVRDYRRERYDDLYDNDDDIYIYSSYSPYRYTGGYYPASVTQTTIVTKEVSPSSYTKILVDGSTYYYLDGAFYRKSANGYTVTTAPINAKVKSLPSEAIVISVKSRDYYYYRGVYFVRGKSDFKVVSPPNSAVVPYLPQDREVKYVKSQKYLIYGNAYYQPVIQGGTTVYRVTRF